MNMLSKLLSAGLLTIASASVVALPTGGGSVSFDGVDGVAFAWDKTADTFDFADGVNAVVTDADGTFAAVWTAGDDATFFDFSYAGGVGALSADIWESEGITFSLTSITFLAEGSSTVSVEGIGTMTDGIDTISTGIALAFSANGTSTFSWSSTTSIPEPAPLALLGLGLVGIALARRKQNAA